MYHMVELVLLFKNIHNSDENGFSKSHVKCIKDVHSTNDSNEEFTPTILREL